MSDIAARFATALDDEDYTTAMACLAENCVYESPTGKVTARESIITSYQDNGDSARDRFDSIVYSHRIRSLDNDWFEVTFVDELTVKKRRHVFRCQQKIRVRAGAIVEIVHKEIPGERDQLNQFLKATGLE